MTVSADQERRFRERFEEYARTLDCVHCGLCIPYCPTHGVNGKEASSPRGRIYLMRGYAEGDIAITPQAKRHLDECIVCRACETVCPSGIRMGEMMESFRSELDRGRKRRGPLYRLARVLLRQVLPHRHRIAALTDVIWVYQRSGLRRLVSLLLRFFPAGIRYFDALQPDVPPPGERRVETERSLRLGYHPAEGKPRMRVALFLGCIASEWFAPTHRATIRVLRKNGCDVLVPEKQTCCGALHRHGGFLDEAGKLYAANRRVFESCGADVVVVNAAGCGAALKEPPADCPGGLGVPVRDISELLDEIGIRPPRARLERRVVYDEPCHLLHAQRVGADAVLGLLSCIDGVEIVPLRDSDRCCGSGGVYNLIHPRLARKIRDEKVEAILEAAPDIVVTGNPGCAMQIGSGLRAKPIEVTHPVDLLDRAYRLETS